MATVTMKELLEAGVHFGHQTKRWNPKMQKYIFGERNGIYIVDLQKTLKKFRGERRDPSVCGDQEAGAGDDPRGSGPLLHVPCQRALAGRDADKLLDHPK